MYSVSHFFLAHATAVQTSLFAFILTTTWLFEWAFQPQLANLKWRHTALNSLFIVSALPIQIGMMLLCVCVSRWTTQHHWGLIYLLPNAEQPLIKYGLMFVALDFLDYVYHVTMHHVGVLWRFHLVHHTDQAVDVSTTVREHPGETFIRNCFLILWVFLCGASLEVLILRQTTETISNLLSHSALRLPPKFAQFMGWLLITPNLHHVHHHYVLPATNRNYGDVFSVWDRLFGTFANLPPEATVFGCLLYTSPSPRDRTRSRMPSSA